MSVVQNPLIGRARQKLGGTVFTTWKGINVIKGKPLTVANPRTDPQIMRRSAMSQIVELARLLTGALNLGFKEQAVRKSAFNAFVGYNLRNAFNYTAPPVATLTPATLLVSQGTVSPTAISAISADESINVVAVDWTSASLLPGQSNADSMQCVVYNENKDIWVSTHNPAVRTDNSISMTLPTGFVTVGDVIRAYLFSYNSASRKSSDSTTATEVALP